MCWYCSDRKITGESTSLTLSWLWKSIRVLTIRFAELGMTGYVMFRKDRLGRRGGELFYILKNPSKLMK